MLFSRLLKLHTHVNDLDLRQRPLLHPIRQFEQRVLVLLRVEIGFERRRSRAQHHHRPSHLRPHHRHIARVISRRLFLLVRRILLLIHDHQRQIRNRSEHRRARAHYHARLSALDAMPLLRPLLIRQRRVQNSNFFTEHMMQISRHCRRKPDLRNQQDRRPSRLENRTHRRQINRSLARSSHPMQQHARKLPGAHALLNLLQRILLRGIELKIERRRPSLHACNGELDWLLDDLNQPSLHQRRQRCAGHVERLQSLDG